MPTSFGSIGKQYTHVINDIKFNRFIGQSFLKIHNILLSVLTTVPLEPCLIIDQKVFKINNETTNYGFVGFAAKFSIGQQQTIRLYDQKTGNLIKETKTDITGSFSFQNLSPQKKYTLTTKDEDDILESVILDTISPKIITL